MPNIDPEDFSSVGTSGGGGSTFGSFSAGNPFSSGSAFGGLTGGISSIFSGIGDLAEASDYGKAAQIAMQNAALAKESGQIQETQEARKVFQITGQQSAAAGAGNLGPGGSMGDVLRSSLIQGGLQHQLIGLQAGIEANSFKQQATAYEGQASAAKAAGAGGILGGVLGIAGSFFGL